ATWCPPCRESIPVLQELYRDYAKKGFTVVGVSLDQDPSAVAPFAREKNLTYPILLAGESNVSELYGVRGIPTIYLLNKEGQIVDRWIGYDSSYRDEWRGSIDKLLLNS
ncbi:MAG: TlpA family protein disulfide reductase, partial [Elusimicrobia bacterium]|nr:TlpA family protein disulfide reductase [Elusimicrobiota bacterium]